MTKTAKDTHKRQITLENSKFWTAELAYRRYGTQTLQKTPKYGKKTLENSNLDE
jgi:hypothetical protein